MGIEPILFAWKAKDLPLIYIRKSPMHYYFRQICRYTIAEQRFTKGGITNGFFTDSLVAILITTAIKCAQKGLIFEPG